jgi:drug/metabolite transporter (DMT)-like permease
MDQLTQTPQGMKTALLQQKAQKKSALNPWGKERMVPICTCLVIISSVCERLAFKAMLDNMNLNQGHYRYFLAQLVTFFYVPITFAFACRNSCLKIVTPEMVEFPKRKFVLIGILDMLQTMLVMIPGGKIRGPLTVVLLQITIPLTTLLGRIFLKTNYGRYHAAGALLITAGVFINLVPSMHAVAQKDAGLEDGWYSIAYLLAGVPAAISIVYKEAVLRSQPMDICYFNAWCSFFQFFFGLFLGPALKSLNQEIDGSFACLVGTGEGCWSGNLFLVFGFILSNCAVGLSISMILHYK